VDSWDASNNIAYRTNPDETTDLLVESFLGVFEHKNSRVAESGVTSLRDSGQRGTFNC
jgi:hypothetical protein